MNLEERGNEIVMIPDVWPVYAITTVSLSKLLDTDKSRNYEVKL